MNFSLSKHCVAISLRSFLISLIEIFSPLFSLGVPKFFYNIKIGKNSHFDQALQEG